MKPRVSIVTALHNKAPYIAATLRSVQAQTVADWEMIIVENGSSDGGPGVVSEFRDPRIRLITSQRLGPGAARNSGFRLAGGEWILFLDADDLLAPDYLEQRLGDAEVAAPADIVAGPWTEFSDGGRPEAGIVRQPAGYDATVDVVRTSALGSAPWALHAALTRRSTLSRLPEWPEPLDAAPSEDAAFWFPVVMSARIAWSRGAGALYRRHTPTSRDNRSDARRRTDALISIIAYNLQYLTSAGLTPTTAQCADVVRVLEQAHDYSKAAGAMDCAERALAAADTWLRRCGGAGVAMRARRLVGLRAFNWIRAAQKRLHPQPS